MGNTYVNELVQFYDAVFIGAIKFIIFTPIVILTMTWIYRISKYTKEIAWNLKEINKTKEK